MPAHPTRRTYRNGERTRSTFRAPFAAGIALAENPNRGKHSHSPRLVDCSDTETSAAILGVTPLHWVTGERGSDAVTVSTPLRDSLGRRNPRMGASSYSV